LKKVEQELIKRRYKYPHHYNPTDQISRVALVYGQATQLGPTVNSYRNIQSSLQS